MLVKAWHKDTEMFFCAFMLAEVEGLRAGT